MNSKILCNLPVKDSDNIVWASLVAQKVKKLPAMQKTWVRSLGWEDPLEEGLATHSSIQIWALIMNPEIFVQSTCQRIRQYRNRSKCGTFLLPLVSLHSVQSVLYFISLCCSVGSNSVTNLPRNLGTSFFFFFFLISVAHFSICSLIFLLTVLPDLHFSESLFSCPAAVTQESCG